MKLLKTILLATGLGIASTGHAALITQTVDFTFANVTPLPAPYDPVTGSFSVTYDSDFDVVGQSVDSISFVGTNFSTSNVYFNYTINATYFNLDIYYDHDGAGTADPHPIYLNKTDFLIYTSGPLTNNLVSSGYMMYTQTGDFNFYSSNSLDSTLNSSISAVPVPAAVWLFGSGLIGLIGIARCKNV